MFERVVIHLKRHHRHIKKRSRQQFPIQNARLMQMQPSRPRKNHRVAGPNLHRLVALAVEIIQSPRKRLKNIFDPALVVLPDIRRRILEIQHHARRARIQHLYHQVCLIRWPSHLVALIRAPRRQFNSPRASRRLRRRQIIRQFPGIRLRQRNLRAAQQAIRCLGVNASCSGRRNSRNPAGRSLFASNPRGARFTGTTRFTRPASSLIGFVGAQLAFRVVLVVFVVAHRNSMHNPATHGDHDGVDSRIGPGQSH